MAKKEDFLDTLEKGVKSILEGNDTTVEQKIQAITAGAKIMTIRRGVPDDTDKPGSFFNKGK